MNAPEAGQSLDVEYGVGEPIGVLIQLGPVPHVGENLLTPVADPLVKVCQAGDQTVTADSIHGDAASGLDLAKAGDHTAIFVNGFYQPIQRGQIGSSGGAVVNSVVPHSQDFIHPAVPAPELIMVQRPQQAVMGDDEDDVILGL